MSLTMEKKQELRDIASSAAAFAAKRCQEANGDAVIAILAFLDTEASHLGADEQRAVAGWAFDIFALSVTQ